MILHSKPVIGEGCGTSVIKDAQKSAHFKKSKKKLTVMQIIATIDKLRFMETAQIIIMIHLSLSPNEQHTLIELN
jgi:hypothetical protein